ncbi:MAG: YafY family transcriptional regulator [Chitinophagaceae bacterium]|nr:YafY family transcriptional regulator [Chitinophagaceae bacterium]
MNRIDRLHAILTHLQSKRKVTAQEIADRFNISLRTVYRDVKALDESGVPVIGEAGSGYTVMEGYRLPPVMFNQEEAVALMLGSKLAAQFTDNSVQKQFESALFKIKAVLRSTDKDHVDNLDDHIAIFSGPNKPEEQSSSQYLAVLQKAIVTRNVVLIKYQAGYSDDVTERIIEPIGLCYYGSAWHLIAWCRMRKGYRDFRISRMKTLHVRDETFRRENHPSLQSYLDEIKAQHGSGLLEVSILFHKDVVRFVGEQRYFHGFVSEEKAGDYYRMKFLTSHLEGMGRWLLMFTDAVKVEAPIELIAAMQTLVDELQQMYSSKTASVPIRQ